VSSAFWVHSHLLVDFFSKSDVGDVTMVYLRMNRWSKIVNPRSA